MIVLLLFLPFVLFLTFDGQRAIREFDVDITLVHSRQLDRDFVRLLMLGDVHGWSLAPGDLAAPERLDVEHAASGRRHEPTPNSSNSRSSSRRKLSSGRHPAARLILSSSAFPGNLIVSSAMALSPDTGRRLRRKHQTRAASEGR